MASSEDEIREALEGSEPSELRKPRASRLVEPDEGDGPDDEEDLVAEAVEDDDDPYLSAEEAAVHIEDAP